MLAATAVLHLKQAFCSYVNFTGTGIKIGSLALAQLFFEEMQSHLCWNTALTHKKGLQCFQMHLFPPYWDRNTFYSKEMDGGKN